MTKDRTLILVLTLAIGIVELLNMRERRAQWKYSAYIHSQTGAATAPAEIWEGR